MVCAFAFFGLPCHAATYMPGSSTARDAHLPALVLPAPASYRAILVRCHSPPSRTLARYHFPRPLYTATCASHAPYFYAAYLRACLTPACTPTAIRWDRLVLVCICTKLAVATAWRFLLFYWLHGSLAAHRRTRFTASNTRSCHYRTWFTVHVCTRARGSAMRTCATLPHYTTAALALVCITYILGYLVSAIAGCAARLRRHAPLTCCNSGFAPDAANGTARVRLCAQLAAFSPDLLPFSFAHTRVRFWPLCADCGTARCASYLRLPTTCLSSHLPHPTHPTFYTYSGCA